MKPGVIETYTGKMFNVLVPNLDDLDIVDIAYGLAAMPRWGGQSKTIISVAMHSIWVSGMVPEKFALEALMHDATEAYLMDMPRPIKMLLNEYQEIEWLLDQSIRRKYKLPLEMSPEVKEADNKVLEYEKNVLKGKYMVGFKTDRDAIAIEFIKRFEELTNTKV